MKIRHLLSILGISTLLCSGWSSTVFAQADKEAPIEPKKRSSDASQKIAQPTIAISSAKGRALASAGITRDPVTGDRIVAQALYVKLRRGYAGSNAPATVQRLAARAQVGVDMATPLTYSTVPLEPQLEKKNKSAASARRNQIDEAEENLRHLVELHYTTPMTPRDAARQLMRLPEVEYAEPMALPELFGAIPDDPMVLEQYQLAQVKAFEAWDLWKGDTTMTIAIVDAGVDMFHEDLAPNIQENPGERGLDAQGNPKSSNRLDDDGNGQVDDWRGANLTWQDDGSTPGNTKGSGHGTQVAGLAAAATNNTMGIAGIGYRCRFFPIKAATLNGGALTHAYEGIAYAARRGFKVINCSWGGGGRYQSLQDIITNLTLAYDCAIVAGGGNDLVYKSNFPAGYRHVLGVGAVTKDDIHNTAWGEQVDIVSPGGFSTNENNNYLTLIPATSYATPVVSGALALVRSRYPNLTADQSIAHLRLMADSVAVPEPNRQKLTGYGRLNIHRAISTDPFSHPAVIIDSVWLVNEKNEPIERSPVGGRGSIRFRVKNILGSTSNVRVRVVSYSTDSNAVAIDTSWIDLGDLATNQSKDAAGGSGFGVQQPYRDRVRLRFEIISAGGYNDYHYERILFYQPYITVSTSQITVSLADHGRLGYEDADNTIGEGFRYLGRSFLYEGGFIIAADSVRVLSNVRGAIPGIQQEDFTPVEYPSPANNYTLTLNDSLAGDRRIGLLLHMRLIASDSVPNAVMVELRTVNRSPATLDTLRIAMFSDWDLDSMDQGQRVAFASAPADKVPFYGLFSSLTGFHLTQGVVGPEPHPVFYAIRNDSLPFRMYEGFDNGEKWATVSNGIGVRVAGGFDSSDVSLVIGKRAVDLAPGAEDTTLFVIAVSNSPFNAIRAMRDRAPGLPGTTSVRAERGEPARLLGTPQPNPSNSMITFTVGRLDRDATLSVYDEGGKLVADLRDRLPRDGGTVTFDASMLPSGIYHLRLESTAGAESQRFVLAK